MALYNRNNRDAAIEIKALQGKVQSQNFRIRNLEKEIDSLKASVIYQEWLAQKMKNKKLKDEIERLKQDKKDSKKTIQSQKTEISSLQKELQKSEKNHAAQIEKKEDQIRKLQEEKGSIEQSLQTAESESAQLKLENVNLKEELKKKTKKNRHWSISSAVLLKLLVRFLR